MDSARSPLRPSTEWHSRRRLPHWEAGAVPQATNFRLADSLPRAVLEARPAGETPIHRRQRYEASLDAGHGEGVLARPDIGALIQGALLHFHGSRYDLHAWCVMPNHVHVLCSPAPQIALSGLVHSWKSFTAKAINTRLRRTGALWAGEYFDRVIRDDAHFAAAASYIEDNPVKAGLCADPGDWPFSSAGRVDVPSAS